MLTVDRLHLFFYPSHCTQHIIEKFQCIPQRIAQWLSKMCKLRIINTQAYAEEVAKKKVRAKTAKPKVGPTLRQVKRKLCTVLKQNKKLRGKVGVCSLHL